MKKIEVTDIKGLLSEKVVNMSIEIPGTTNDSYGTAYHLKRYAEIDTNIPLNCTLEHGLCYIETVCQYEVSHHNSHILTLSPFREKVIRKLTRLIPVAIGPYIAYAENYCSKEYIDEVRKENGRTLLVMPSHSIQGIDIGYDVRQFIDEIEKVKKDFDTVLVCIYFEDLKKGLWKPYRKKGYKIVSAGNTSSLYFLERLKYIFSLSDAVIANSATTGLAYAMYMDMPIRLIQQNINYNMTCHNNVFELETESQIANMHKIFGSDRFTTFKEHQKYSNYIFGLDKVKSKEEMRRLLLPLLRF